MACFQSLEGILKDCEASMGGIVMAYIANRNPANGADQSIAVFEEDQGPIIEFALDDPFRRFYTRKGASSMTSTVTADPATGVGYITTEVVLTFPKMTLQKRYEIQRLLSGEFVVVVQDANGLLWAIGVDSPAQVTAGTGQTGTAAGDANNFTITLKEEGRHFPYIVSDLSIMTIE